MKLTFLGTRGEIEARSPLHQRHTPLEVAYRGARLMIDAGRDWLGELERVRPAAIVVTHAHPDHAWGLREGAPCPVWATAETWGAIGAWPIRAGHTVEPRKPFTLQGITFEAFPVEHSTRAPAVGYRIWAGRAVVFYAPDLVYIPDRGSALGGARLYIGDGATLTRSFVRRSQGRLIGHAPVRTQLGWCRKEGIGRMIVTHCGTEIVTGDPRGVAARLQELAAERGVAAELAYDGMEVFLR